jgi:WD40 repeat protein
VQLWQVDTRTPQGLVLGRHTDKKIVRDVAVSVDGRIASGGDDGKVLMWDPVKRESQDLDTGPRQWSPVECLDFSRDGKLLAFGRENGVIEIWAVERPRRISTLTGHRDIVRDVTFNNDGTRLASASVDSTVRIWDIASEKQIHELRGHQGVVWKVAYSADGSLLASAGREGTIRLWRADDGTSVGFPIAGHKGPVRSLAFSPEGRELASVSDDMTLRFWPTVPSADALCAKLTTNMSDEEWTRSISSEAEYRKVCENLPIAERDYSAMPQP